MTEDADKEMYSEISALMGSIGKALSLSESDTIQAVERGEMSFEMGKDENGHNFVAVTYKGDTARIYQGAIKREADPQ